MPTVCAGFFRQAVGLVYLCVIRRVRFSFLLTSNLVALTTLPTIAAALLCMVTSLISPYIGMVMILIGEVASYVILCTLIGRITGIPDQFCRAHQNRGHLHRRGAQNPVYDADWRAR